MILSASQIRAWDEFTIKHEPISSIDLMERAAWRCVRWLEENGYEGRPLAIFCGKGNNGGDGLAIARLMAGKSPEITVHILEFGHKGTQDFQQNLARLHGMPVTIKFVQTHDHFPTLPTGYIIIDALLGSGLNRPLEGVTAELVEHLNASGHDIISIDIPSGLFVEKSSKGNTVIRARHTLSFQCYKPALLVAENEAFTGQVHILDIGLHAAFLNENARSYSWIDKQLVKNLYRPRRKFSHKGTFGHALLVAGSYGKMGAAVLAAKGCLRSGVGLLTVYVPAAGMHIMQTAVPEAMCVVEKNEVSLDIYKTIGIGPGLGTGQQAVQLMEWLLQQAKGPLVLDADALNIISSNPHLLQMIPSYSIITPHPREFERLFGKSNNDFERIDLALENAKARQLMIVLKGGYTFIASPSGKAWFNSSGNPGLATGGTGDVLTGIITGLLAQGYSPEDAAVFGAFWHGLAGDIASSFLSPESLIASDVPEALGSALQRIIG